jgi:hypothetical protein
MALRRGFVVFDALRETSFFGHSHTEHCSIVLRHPGAVCAAFLQVVSAKRNWHR